MRTQRRCFTLIELLVVVAIIALLISILLPSLSKAKENARLSVCLSNLHHLAVAMEQYFNDYNHVLPAATIKPSLNPEDPNDELYREPIYDILKPYTKNDEIFRCPSDLPGKTKRDEEWANQSYFDSEGTSYEYQALPEMVQNWLEPIGMRVKFDVGDLTVSCNLIDMLPKDIRSKLDFWIKVPTSDLMLLRGFDKFHGYRGTNLVRPTLYADCHVEEVFRMPWGVDPNYYDDLISGDPNALDPNLY